MLYSFRFPPAQVLMNDSETSDGIPRLTLELVAEMGTNERVVDCVPRYFLQNYPAITPWKRSFYNFHNTCMPACSGTSTRKDEFPKIYNHYINDWLIGWIVASLTDCLIGWLFDWLAVWLIDWSIDWLIWLDLNWIDLNWLGWTWIDRNWLELS